MEQHRIYFTPLGHYHRQIENPRIIAIDELPRDLTDTANRFTIGTYYPQEGQLPENPTIHGNDFYLESLNKFLLTHPFSSQMSRPDFVTSSELLSLIAANQYDELAIFAVKHGDTIYVIGREEGQVDSPILQSTKNFYTQNPEFSKTKVEMYAQEARIPCNQLGRPFVVTYSAEIDALDDNNEKTRIIAHSVPSNRPNQRRKLLEFKDPNIYWRLFFERTSTIISTFNDTVDGITNIIGAQRDSFSTVQTKFLRSNIQGIVGETRVSNFLYEVRRTLFDDHSKIYLMALKRPNEPMRNSNDDPRRIELMTFHNSIRGVYINPTVKYALILEFIFYSGLLYAFYKAISSYSFGR